MNYCPSNPRTDDAFNPHSPYYSGIEIADVQDAWFKTMDMLLEHDPLAFVDEVMAKDEDAAAALAAFVLEPTVNNADQLADAVKQAKDRIIDEKTDFPPVCWSV